MTERAKRLGTLLVGILTAWTAFGQAAPDAPRDTFSDIIDVRVVEVEVVVTDRGGLRVPDLTASDFKLLVDGEPTPIEYFSEVRGGALVETDGSESSNGSGAEEVLPAEIEDPGRNYLVFIDDYFTDRRYRHRLLGNLIGNVGFLRPSDQMAIVRFEGYGLEVLSPWTSSHEDLEKAIAEARKRTPRELIRKTLATVSANPVQRSRLLARQIEEVANAIAVAMRSFSHVEGRKLLLPVTEGWVFDPNLDLSGGGVGAERTLVVDPTAPLAGGLNPNPNEGQMGNLPGAGELLQFHGIELLYPMIDTANLLGYTIYPMGLGTIEIGGGGEVQRSSLWILARETGGRIATEGAAAKLPLEPVVEDTSSYYVLGFSPDRAWDGKRHKVEIEVTGEGLKIRHRRNFLDLSRGQRIAMQTEEALLMGTGGDLDVRLGEFGKSRRELAVPVTLKIPMDWVTMIPQGKQYTSALELRVAALDEKGGRSEIPAIPIELSGPKPTPGSHAVYETLVKVRKIEQRLVLYLYDTLSGESKVAALEIDP